MSWYKTGKVTLTNGSRDVTGVGTDFARYVQVGEGFLAPDGELYEIQAVISSTLLRLGALYAGPSVIESSAYAIAPVQGYVRELALRAAELIDAHAAVPAQAQTSADEARLSADGAAASATQAGTFASQAGASAAAAEASADAALESQNSAAQSQQAASASSQSASESAAAAAQSQVQATDASALALAAKTAAESAATASSASADAAAASAAAALASQATAAADAASAADSKAGAEASASDALASALSSGQSEAMARDWATKPAGEVVVGQGYSAYKSASDAAASAGAAAVSKDGASASAASAADSAADAAASESAASASANSAANSATAASASAGLASASAAAADASAVAADGSAIAASSSAVQAQASAVAAANSASAADASMVAASSSAGSAGASASDAQTSASEAKNWAVKTDGEVQVGQGFGAKKYAQDAATSALQARGHATSAADSSAAAGTSATGATNAMNAAQASALAASSDATAATGAASAAAASETAASTSAAAAANSASQASTSESAAAASASSAQESATQAAASAISASTSAATAGAKAADSSTSATQASDAATLAESWANAEVGVQVKPGEYSAKHWALQAQSSVTGALVYRGGFDASAGAYPTSPTLGDYYKISGDGAVGGIDYKVNDSIIYNGSSWDKIDSTDSVTSVAGRVGAVELTKADVGLGSVDNTPDSEKPISAATQAALATLAPLTGEGAMGTWPISVSGNAATASKVAASRSIVASGDASWSVSFDGSEDVSAALTLANSGVVAGTYNTTTQIHPFTVDSKGRITSVGAPISIASTWASISGKPTTLAGYGITDAASAGHTHNYIPMTGATNPGQLAYDSSWVDANFLWKKNGVQRWALGKDGADNMALWVYNSSGSYIGAYTFGNGTEAVMPWGLRSRSNIVVEHGSPTIEFRDTDHIVRYVHCNDNNIGFLTSSYGWAARSQDDGAFVVTGNIAAFSDERLKTNIEIIPNALDKVMALRGVTYSRTDVGGRQTGLIAQDVRSVLPEAVIEDDDEMKTLSVVYGNLVGLLVEAIKELKAEVNALKGGK